MQMWLLMSWYHKSVLRSAATIFTSNQSDICFVFLEKHHTMMTSSNGNIFRVTGPLCGEFPTKRTVTRSLDVFFDLHLNKQLSKQWWGWWFESRPWELWNPLSKTVFSKCNFILNNGLVNILNDHKAQKWLYVTPVNNLLIFWHWWY